MRSRKTANSSGGIAKGAELSSAVSPNPSFLASFSKLDDSARVTTPTVLSCFSTPPGLVEYWNFVELQKLMKIEPFKSAQL